MRRGLENPRKTTTAFRTAACASVASLLVLLALGIRTAGAADDSYRPPSDTYSGQSGVDTYQQAPPPGSYQPPSSSYPPPAAPRDSYPPYGSSRTRDSDPGGYGAPYASPPQSASRDGGYYPPPAGDPPAQGTYSENEIIRAGNSFFGEVSGGLAKAVEWAFQQAGRPNGYILGQDAGGAFFAGLSYGEGTLYTKDAGSFRVYWQGPSVGYDFGGDGSKVMTLVYNLRDPSDIYDRFGGVEGTAYLVGGISVQIQKAGHVTLAPIRAGVGLRLGANVGYLKYTRSPTWNPF